MADSSDIDIDDPENPEWTAEDFANALPAAVVLREIFPKHVADELLKGPHARPDDDESARRE